MASTETCHCPGTSPQFYTVIPAIYDRFCSQNLLVLSQTTTILSSSLGWSRLRELIWEIRWKFTLAACESDRRKIVSLFPVLNYQPKHAVGTSPSPDAKWRLLLLSDASAKQCSPAVCNRAAPPDLAVRAAQFGHRTRELGARNADKALTQVHLPPISTTGTMQGLTRLLTYPSHVCSAVPLKSPWYLPAAMIRAAEEKNKALRKRHAPETAVARIARSRHECRWTLAAKTPAATSEQAQETWRKSQFQVTQFLSCWPTRLPLRMQSWQSKG